MLPSFFGNTMHQVARGWLALQLTGEAASIGWVMASWGVPMLIFSLPGGAVADRFNRKWVLLLAQAGQGLMALAIAVLLVLDVLEMWHLLAAGVWQGVMFSFNGPARQALLPELVGERALANAIALNNAAMNSTRILGPAVAGVLLAAADASLVYFVMTG
ncbi:MAG: MFS transporter, partial [Gammaproteobacteria bacterium]|nr:MFS transporter [Gammaproteobacteria bacterium]